MNAIGIVFAICFAIAAGVTYVLLAIFSHLNQMDKSRNGPISRIVACFGGFLAFLMFFFVFLKPYEFVDSYELGYRYDARNGQITVLPQSGYWERIPFVQQIHTVDLRPRQVCINVGSDSEGHASVGGANQRVLNCKLVRFDPAGLMTFLSWHGRQDYDGSTLNDLLKIYAYDNGNHHYPFLVVLRELKSDDASVTDQQVNK